MQAHPGFEAQSGNQLQAGPPLTPSSQYQPLGHTPLPQLKQLPSPQSLFGACVSTSLSELPAASLSSSAPASAGPSCEADSLLSGSRTSGVAEPQPASPRSRSKGRLNLGPDNEGEGLNVGCTQRAYNR
jgi:hypothetical protein